jgi:hypothetical protein
VSSMKASKRPMSVAVRTVTIVFVNLNTIDLSDSTYSRSDVLLFHDLIANNIKVKRLLFLSGAM